MKPHIFKRNGWWWCVSRKGYPAGNIGITPAEAYSFWQRNRETY